MRNFVTTPDEAATGWGGGGPVSVGLGWVGLGRMGLGSVGLVCVVGGTSQGGVRLDWVGLEG